MKRNPYESDPHVIYCQKNGNMLAKIVLSPGYYIRGCETKRLSSVFKSLIDYDFLSQSIAIVMNSNSFIKIDCIVGT